MAPTKNLTRAQPKVVKKGVCRPNSTKRPLKACITSKHGNLGPKPPKLERKVSNLRKIELANEVALEQLLPSSELKVPIPIKIEPEIISTQVKKKPTLKLKRKQPLKTQEAKDTPPETAKLECKPKRGRKPVVSQKATNIKSDSEPESWQVIPKKPGPKSRTMTLIIPTIETLVKSDSQNTVVRAKGGPRQPLKQKITDYFSEPTDDATPKTVGRRATKRKQAPKKPIDKGSKSTQPERKPRNKFVTERQNGNNTITRSKGKLLTTTDIKSAAAILDNALKGPANVQTRSNSVNSSNSNLSWTRDISTASSLSDTTTCLTVCSTDFVRFDRKLPFIQLENVDRFIPLNQNVDEKLEDSLSSSDTESSESSSDSELDASIDKPELNLSTSSLSVKSNNEDESTNTHLISLEMDKLTNYLKDFYKDMEKFMAYDDNTDTCSSMLDALKLEKDIFDTCDKFDSIIGTIRADTSPEKEYQKKDNVSIEPVNENTEDSINIPILVPKDLPEPTNFVSSESFTSDNCNYQSFEDRNFDDGDTISLFAESITGMESSRISSVSNMSIQEPLKPAQWSDPYESYIPKPTRPLPPRYSYRPTKIEKDCTKRVDVPLKTIEPNMVHKQNADSSSISKEIDFSKKAMHLLQDASRLSALANDSMKTCEEPSRILPRYQPILDVKSAVYRGACFFYIATQCKNINGCRFPHIDVEANVVSCRLKVLTEDSLIEEYLLTVKYKSLRRKFGLLFMKECASRNSTRVVLEMAIDLGLGVIEREDKNLNINALETTLLHLNTISFDALEDLLTFEYNNTMLCDTLLLRMAYSQNFSQFKAAFVKLTHFMAVISRRTDIETVGNILERVCILPCDDAIARGMLCLMKNTDARIFESNMAKTFEYQLSSADSDVYDSYLVAKKEMLIHKTPVSPVLRSRESQRHPSPDTTNFDSLKKAQMAPPTTFKRTIDTDPIRHLFKSPANPAPKTRYVQRRYTHQLNNTRIYKKQTNHRSGGNT